MQSGNHASLTITLPVAITQIAYNASFGHHKALGYHAYMAIMQPLAVPQPLAATQYFKSLPKKGLGKSFRSLIQWENNVDHITLAL